MGDCHHHYSIDGVCTTLTPRPTLLARLARSLIGHVVVYHVAFTLPMSALFLYWDYSDRTLTVGQALRTIALSSVFGLVVAILIWYTITLPLLRRAGRR